MIFPTRSRILAGIRFSGQAAADKVCAKLRCNPSRQPRLLCVFLLLILPCEIDVLAQQQTAPPAIQLPDAPSASVLSGTVTDTDEAIISNA